MHTWIRICQKRTCRTSYSQNRSFENSRWWLWHWWMILLLLQMYEIMFNEPFEFHDWACFLSTWRVCLEILFLEFWNRKRFQISTWLKTTNGEKNIFFQVEILMWIFEVFNAAALVPRKSCYISKSEEDKQNF